MDISEVRARCIYEAIGWFRIGFCNVTYSEEEALGGSDRAGVPDLSVSGDKFDLAEDDPHDPTTTSEPKAPMQSLNQLPVVTDLVDARSA